MQTKTYQEDLVEPSSMVAGMFSSVTNQYIPDSFHWAGPTAILKPLQRKSLVEVHWFG